MILLTDAAKWYQELEHQDRAWDWLQDEVGVATLAKFAAMYRSGPTLDKESKDKLTGKEYVNKQQLAAIWNCAESLIFDYEIVELNNCLAKWDIVYPLRIRHFLAQTATRKWWRQVEERTE